MLEYDNEDLIRSFEEFDEQLPHVAKVIVRREIDFSLLTEGEDYEEGTVDQEKYMEALQSVVTVFREMIECTSEMTADEFEHYTAILLTACELVVMVNDGLAYEEKGNIHLTPEGKELLCEAEES